MRICLIGKFPPIQGGVSMRTYWAAHGLASRGHEVHVVTNAKEAQPPFRMHMREEDWQRCEATYGSGSVTVHWTDPVDRSQAYIPMASPFVSKLAGIAVRLHSERPFSVIHSFYLEPYGVAGHLAAQMTGIPHVTRTAGSDAGHLWRHHQLQALYDHVLRSAAVVIAGNIVAARAIQRGVDANCIALASGVAVPEDLFTPAGPRLDLAALRSEVSNDSELRDLCWGEFTGGRPYFGVYGKLGDTKGSFALLAAMHRLKNAGLDVGLVALAHGSPAVERRFRAEARDFGLADRILQLPFLPHWRVAQFIRSCLAVCCLEQDFPIRFHSPVMPREVLLCGTCLVAATEVIRKLPEYSQLPHGFACVAVQDVNDVDTLSKQLAAIVEDPAPAPEVGARGREFARLLQRNVAFPDELERTLEAAAVGRRVRSQLPRLGGEYGAASVCPSTRGGESNGISGPIDTTTEAGPRGSGHFWLCQLAASALRQPVARAEIQDLASARQLLVAIEERIADGREDLRGLVPAVQVEIAIAAAESDADATTSEEHDDVLFRLRLARWGMTRVDLARLLCVREPRVRLLTFDFDVGEFMSVRSADDLATPLTPRRSYMAVFGRSADSDRWRRDPLVIDAAAARILDLSNGTRSVSQILALLNQDGCSLDHDAGIDRIEKLFSHGLILLRDAKLNAVHEERRPDRC